MKQSIVCTKIIVWSQMISSTPIPSINCYVLMTEVQSKFPFGGDNKYPLVEGWIRWGFAHQHLLHAYLLVGGSEQFRFHSKPVYWYSRVVASLAVFSGFKFFLKQAQNVFIDRFVADNNKRKNKPARLKWFGGRQFSEWRWSTFWLMHSTTSNPPSI